MKKWIQIVITLQIMALAFIAGKREWIYHFGEVVYLKTAPVDPRDIFRGDYVQLSYDLAVPNNTIDKPSPESLTKNQPIYIQLHKDERGVANASAITTEPPENVSFIKGYYHPSKNFRLGIEKYFIEQGSGTAIEKKRGTREGWQTAMEMEVALGGDGTAVIKGYRWNTISMKLSRILPDESENTTETNPSDIINPVLSLSFKNTGINDVVLLDNTHHCSFTLFSLKSNKNMQWANKHCANAVFDKKVLKNNEVYQFTIDFNDEQWHILDPDDNFSATTLAALKRNWRGYRLIYQAPNSINRNISNNIDKNAGNKASKDNRIYASSLKTPRFRASGRVD